MKGNYHRQQKHATAIASRRDNINVATRRSRPKKKLVEQSRSTLDRTTFLTDRAMDFFSEKELVAQTGHSREEWPLVIVKELVDNALDACEEANIAPKIEITADACGIGVRDNGPGLPESTLRAVKDFTVRVSNREAYVAPDRGAQGNALKTLLSMPFVLDSRSGRLVVDARGNLHSMTCAIDNISQRPLVNHDIANSRSRGTRVRLEWSRQLSGSNPVWPFQVHTCVTQSSIADLVHRLAEGFAIFNPHAKIVLDWCGKRTIWNATNLNWQKWRPNRPTSAHWYELRHFERLVGAYFTYDRMEGSDRLISDFLSEFDGLAGSKNRSRVLRETNLHRVRLSELVAGDRLDSECLGRILESMQRNTRPVIPKSLGLIGEEHLRTRLIAMGVQQESFVYTRNFSKSKKSQIAADGEACFSDSLPHVIEAAFGYLGDDADRRLFLGTNWSAAINNPFRSFGTTGEGLEALLTDLRVGADEPVVVVLHLAQPRLEFTDRGKSAVVIGGTA